MPASVMFKRANSPAEFEQIHRMNYRTFAEEIGQYTPDGSEILVDRFHDRNVYLIAVQDGRMLGMLSAQGQPPYSIESRLGDPAILTSLSGALLEVRLLALDPDCRHGMILPGLLWELYWYARENAYSHLIISAITSRLRMYERIGFRALGPAVVCGAARFMPMALPLKHPPEHLARRTNSFLARRMRLDRNVSGERPTVSLMPGPVEISPDVRAAFLKLPISHRSPEFIGTYERARSILSSLGGQMRVAILTGSGTTANDAVALHLRAACQDSPGLVLVNGEFGERLSRHATRAGLQFETLRWPWGQPWDLGQISQFLDRGAAWLWAVHLETGTGVLNGLTELTELAAAHAVLVAADCVSSIGAVRLPDRGIWMSTGVSGKAIGAYPGLSFVFASELALEQAAGHKFPASLDVRAAVSHLGPQFTTPSSLVSALDAALANYATEEDANRCFTHYELAGRVVRAGLRRLGIAAVAADVDAAPCVTTFAIPYDGFLERCLEAGFELGGSSSYLADRGWAQIATMGTLGATPGRAKEVMDRLLEGLAA